jgi:hypothetical protein
MITLQPEDMIRVVAALPSDLCARLESDPTIFLAGGCIRALVAGEQVSDFDVFGPDKTVLGKHASDLHFARIGQQARPTLINTPNAITVLTIGRIPVQFITRWVFINPVHGILSFDFTIAQAAVWYDGGAWRSCCTEAFYFDLAARRLTYTFPTRDEDACGSLLRVRKYLRKGYTIQAAALAGTIARAVCGIKELGIKQTEPEVTELLVKRIREVDPLQIVDGMELRPDHFVDDGVAQGES